MIASFYANSNWDGENSSKREEIVEHYEDSYKKAVHTIYTGEVEEEDEIKKDDPFFSAGQKALDRLNLPPAKASGALSENLPIPTGEEHVETDQG